MTKGSRSRFFFRVPFTPLAFCYVGLTFSYKASHAVLKEEIKVQTNVCYMGTEHNGPLFGTESTGDSET